MPVLFLTYQPDKNHYNFGWVISVLWLAVVVSIFAIQLWLYLIRHDPVRGSFWLFLCPVSGFIIAAFMLHEPISLYTVVGVLLVIAGLYLVQRKRVDKA